VLATASIADFLFTLSTKIHMRNMQIITIVQNIVYLNNFNFEKSNPNLNFSQMYVNLDCKIVRKGLLTDYHMIPACDT
jgi:hypothetical protein